MSNVLPLGSLTLDEELQPRAAIDRTVLENYVQLLVDGVRFPPVVAFRDGAVLWLADGFHRWHAHKVLDADGIDVEIIDGSRRDALLYSLSANARHGLQRNSIDYDRAYVIACRNGLVGAIDVEAIATLLRCSGRTAERLTATARAAAKAAREQQVIHLKEQGKGSREIERATGIPEATVRRIGAPKAPMAETAQPVDPPAWVQNLRELESPEANAWASALRALRHVNEQVSVDELYDLRFVGFDHVVEVELEKAYDWISTLHGRFVNERDKRRRA
jgi:hypothetical protein